MILLLLKPTFGTFIFKSVLLNSSARFRPPSYNSNGNTTLSLLAQLNQNEIYQISRESCYLNLTIRFL